MVGARDVMYTQQLGSMQGTNNQLERSVMLGKDHYLVQNGQLMLVSQTTTPVKTTVTLDDGSSLTVDGVLTPKTGSKQTLQNGALVWSDGTVWMHGVTMMMAQ